MPRASKAVRRAQIVEGLATLLEHRSYAEASVAEIAREAGLAGGLVHYHFASKREILLALVDRLADSWRDRVRTRQAEVRGPVRRIRALIDATLATGEDARPRDVGLWTTLGAEAARSEDVAHAFRGVLREAQRLLEDDLDALGIRDPARTARSLVAAMEGVFRLAALGLVPAGEGADLVHRLVDALVVER
ncbi:MAG: TetR family transcriptional regulator [Myxococcales bacterium]|nr:TetR family transcriptional regulator [Myxococcales bacterium]MCB9668321.1 TetR family transcriptional regulator [Alphaproteobacteria bacterium]MCB9694451.1 TetR family transcriptional regulator [Alphaproteobacteria bacterium]